MDYCIKFNYILNFYSLMNEEDKYFVVLSFFKKILFKIWFFFKEFLFEI